MTQGHTHTCTHTCILTHSRAHSRARTRAHSHTPPHGLAVDVHREPEEGPGTQPATAAPTLHPAPPGKGRVHCTPHVAAAPRPALLTAGPGPDVPGRRLRGSGCRVILARPLRAAWTVSLHQESSPLGCEAAQPGQLRRLKTTLLAMGTPGAAHSSTGGTLGCKAQALGAWELWLWGCTSPSPKLVGDPRRSGRSPAVIASPDGAPATAPSHIPGIHPLPRGSRSGRQQGQC